MPAPAFPPGVTVTYNQQFRRCGKPDCPRCRPGEPGHGPYWYAYWREGGRLRSRYIGRTPPPDQDRAAPATIAEAPAAPVAPRADALRVRTLGGFAVWTGPVTPGEASIQGAMQPLPVQSWRPKVRALCTCLLSAPEQRAHRDQLLEWLWPTATRDAALHNLHGIVHLLRRAIDVPGARGSHLHISGDLLALVPVPEAPSPVDWLDLLAFERAATQALARWDLAAARAALALYTGEYLPEDRYEEWAAARREDLQRRYLRLLRHAAELCAGQGDAQGAIGYLELALGVDPCHEVSARLLMRLLIDAGRQADAARVYDDLAEALRTHIGLAPALQTQALYDDVRAPSPALPPAGTATILLAANANEDGTTQAAARRRYAALHAAIVAQRGGQAIALTGEDTLGAAIFMRASDALAAACALQVACRAECAMALPAVMALHTGEYVAPSGGERRDARRLYAPVIAHGRRLATAAHAGQIVLTLATRVLVRHNLPPGVRLRPLGAYILAGPSRAETIFQVIHPALTATFPPLKATPANPTNLPAALTSFIGRAREVAAVRRLVLGEGSPPSRLVTLSGAGGCGKTRLALQIATALLNEAPAGLYSDGIWLVELGALQEGDLVTRAIAAALGLREEPGRPALDLLRDHVREKALVLLLDNCEHLLAACAAVADALLRGCPRLHVLATSREPLGTAGEVVYRVPSLSLPQHARAAGEALTGEAVQLFVERARACQPDFALTDRNAPLVERICRRLDGVPLAIELAAARLDVLSLESIDARLDDRFRLLTAGRRTALPRQQTLRATMDWSYSLLSAAERTLLRRLAVFAGGWTLEAAEVVCAGEGASAGTGAAPIAPAIQRDDVLDLLSRLSAKSLVFVELQAGQARYGMLETVRHYALEQIAAGDETAPVRERHYRCYLALAQQAETAQGGPAQGAWATTLERDHDNLRAALRWCRAEQAGTAAPARGTADAACDRQAAPGGRGAAAIALAAALAWFWEVHGHWAEGRRYLDDALAEAAGAEAPPRLRIKAVNWAGRLALRQSDFPRASTCYERGAAQARQLDDAGELATALNGLGNVSLRQSELSRATRCFEEALAIRREMRDKRGMAAILNNLGLVAHNQGNLQRARALHEESLALVRELGNTAGIAASLNNLAIVAWLQGEHDRAVTLHEESIALRRELGDKSGLASELDALALVFQARGELDRAATLHEQSLALRQELGDRWGMATSYDGLGRLAFARRQFAAAARNYTMSLRINRELKDRLSIAEILVDMAMVAAALEQPARAVVLCSAGERLTREVGAAMSPELAERFARARAAPRALLPDAEYARAWDEGQVSALDQVVELALALAPDQPAAASLHAAP